MPGSNKDRFYDDGDHWDGFDAYASGELGPDEPPVNIPSQESGHDKAIISTAARLALLGLGVAASAAGVAATVKHVKRHKRGET